MLEIPMIRKVSKMWKNSISVGAVRSSRRREAPADPTTSACRAKARQRGREEEADGLMFVGYRGRFL